MFKHICFYIILLIKYMYTGFRTTGNLNAYGEEIVIQSD